MLVLLLCSAGVRAEEKAATVSPMLKVATFNLLHGGVFSGMVGDAQHLDQRLAMVEATLQQHNVDIIGVQEASTSRGRGNTAARLAARLGFYYVYAPAAFRLFRSERLNTIVSWLMNFSEGPALLSRFPITTWVAYDLPRCGRWTDPRVLLLATLQTPWGPILAASTHTSGDPCQHRYIVELLRNWRSDFPILLMGDFNAAERSPAMSMFTAEQGFLDVFRILQHNAPGFTCYQNPFLPTPTVSRRIDYLFVLPGKTLLVQLHTSTVFLNNPEQLSDGESLWPSDHYGVLAELGLQPTLTASLPR